MAVTVEEKSTTMPDLVGLPIAIARKIVENANLIIGDILFEETPSPRGVVTRQRPRGGSPVSPEQPVILFVSRSSLINFLPGIYQHADEDSGGFLRNFLWLAQHQLQPIEESLDQVHTYFAPLLTPAKFLPWLSSVVAFTIDEDWPEAKKRLLIKKAIQLYQLRGTRAGLAFFINIFTDVQPEFLENFWPFDGFQIGCSSTVGVDTILMGYIERGHCFTLKLPLAMEDISFEMIKKIHTIVELEKPAHANYYMIFYEKPVVDTLTYMQLGVQSVVGLDSWVGGAEPQIESQ